MAAIHLHDEELSIDQSNDFLIGDFRNPDGTFRTRKIKPVNLGFGGAPLSFTPENVANKTSDGTLAANSNTLYPSEQAVKTYVDGQVVTLNTSISAKQDRLASEITDIDDECVDFFEDYTAGAITTLNKGIGWNNNVGVVSGGTIVSRTGADGRTFQALSLSSGQLGRKMPWGDRWNRIKVVVGWRLNGGITLTTGAPDSLLGICSGTTNMGGSATTDNFMGLRWGSGGADSITFTAGTLINFFDMSTAFRFVSRRATTTTAIATGGSGHRIPATEGYIGWIVYNLWRPVFANDAASVAYSFLEISNDTTLVEYSHAKNCARRLLQDLNSAVGTASQTETAIVGSSSGTNTVAFDQSTGKLDTVNLTWAFNTAGLEICAIGVRKLA
jgi:hypothetical protein